MTFSPPASADVSCTRVASPAGSDSGAGSLNAPFRTAQKLADSLRPGDTGCLREGRYEESVKVSVGGSDGSPVTLTSFPGDRAQIVGRLWVAKGSDYVTVANLDLDGTNAAGDPSPTVNANHTTWLDNDITNRNTAICFVLGSGWGTAAHTLIQHNRIHNCGKLPASNHDHGIYVEMASDTEILDNLIYDNADRGVQLYPSALRTHVAGNVIDGNGQGVIFSGDGGDASNDNTVEDNIITNSKIRNNVESWYPSGNPVGSGNVVRNNCIDGGIRDTSGTGGLATDRTGFSVGPGNVIGRDPKFVDRAGKDFRVTSDSPCAGIANGATGSSGARLTVVPPTGSGNHNSAGNSQPATGSAPSPAVTLSTRVVSPARVRLSGRVRRGRLALYAASARRRRAMIQIRWHGDWYPLRSIAIKRSAFRSSLTLPATLRGRLLKLRAVVPSVGKSHAVHVRTH